MFSQKIISQQEISAVQEIKVCVLKACILKAQENSAPSRFFPCRLLSMKIKGSGSSQRTHPGKLHHTLARFSSVCLGQG